MTIKAQVTCRGWFDPNGDPEGYLFEWYVAPKLNPTAFVKKTALTTTGTMALVNVSAIGPKGSKFYVKVTPWDGEDYGEAINSVVCTINNSQATFTGFIVAATP